MCTAALAIRIGLLVENLDCSRCRQVRYGVQTVSSCVFDSHVHHETIYQFFKALALSKQFTEVNIPGYRPISNEFWNLLSCSISKLLHMQHISTLVARFYKSRCTEVRDRVFALLPISDSTRHHQISCDYTMPTSNLFAEVLDSYVGLNIDDENSVAFDLTVVCKVQMALELPDDDPEVTKALRKLGVSHKHDRKVQEMREKLAKETLTE